MTYLLHEYGCNDKKLNWMATPQTSRTCETGCGWLVLGFIACWGARLGIKPQDKYS